MWKNTLLILITLMMTYKFISTKYTWKNTAAEKLHRKIVMDERKLLLNTECIKQNNTHFRLDVSKLIFLYDKFHDLLVCKTPKAGSNTWVEIFRQIYGLESYESRQDSVKEINNILYKKYKTKDLFHFVFKGILTKNVGTTTRVILTRDPILRLISAYKNKLENRTLSESSKLFYSKLGKKIRNQFRSSGSLEPTFSEFVRFLLRTQVTDYNGHFKPVSLLCLPCHFEYDIIIKMETFSQDTKWLLRNKNINPTASVIPELNKSENSDVKKYLSEISYDQLRQLFNVYKDDFTLFNYSIAPYIKYVKM